MIPVRVMENFKKPILGRVPPCRLWPSTRVIHYPVQHYMCTLFHFSYFRAMCITDQSKVIRKKIILYGGNFNTTSLYNQKVDVHHVNRSKAEELGARRLQRPKIFQLGKKFFLVFSMNQAILIHLPKFCFLAFFGLVAFIKAKRPKFFTVCQITFYFPSNKQIKI